MMGIIRLAALVLLAAVGVGLAVVASASAFSSNPLFTPASGQSVTGEGGASTLKAAGLEISCSQSHVVSGSVASGLLIGGVVIHYLECTFTKGEAESGCPAKSVVGGEGLILTTTLHGILGLLLPSNVTGVLFLPVSSKTITTLAAASKGGKACGPESKVEGNVAAEVSPVGTSQASDKITILDTVKPAIDLTHGLGKVTAKLTAFGETATLEQSECLAFGVATEVT